MKLKLGMAVKELETILSYLKSGFTKEEAERQEQSLRETNSCDTEYSICMSISDTLSQIKAMPDENCGGCKYWDTKYIEKDGTAECLRFENYYPPKEAFCSRQEKK